MEIAELDAREWASLAREAAGATFFHTPQWASIARAADPRLRDSSFGGRLDDGTPFAYPLVTYGGERPTSGLSSFAGCYGGPIAARSLRPEEARDLHEAALGRAGGALEIALGPWSEHGGVPDGFEAAADFTQVLDLEPEFDELLAAASKGHRQAYRRSIREGIEVRAVDPADAWGAYLGLYESQLERWGGLAGAEYRPETFEGMAAIAGEHPDAIRLWLAFARGEAVSGVWTFYWNGHAVLWHNATRDLGHGMISPVTALYGEVIRDARERGFARFDFNPSGGHERVASFKRRFGAAELRVLRLRATGAPGLAGRARALARRVLGRAPVSA